MGSVLQVQNEKVYIGIMCKLAETLHRNYSFRIRGLELENQLFIAWELEHSKQLAPTPI